MRTAGRIGKAVQEGDTARLKAVVETLDSRSLKEELEVRDPEGRSPLINAAIDRPAELVGILISAGADINAHDNQGATALHLAAIHYRPDVIDALIAAGADPNKKDTWGNGPLSRAVFNSKGRGDAIRRLIDGGADPDAANKAGVTARQLALKIANFDIKQYFGH